MSLCGECGQERPVNDSDLLATHMDAYRASFGMLKELWNREPTKWETLQAARFLAGAEPTKVMDTDGVFDDEDD